MRKTVWITSTIVSLTFICLTVWVFERASGLRSQMPAVPQLDILTYPSFMSPKGPGPKLAKAFEKICKCKVRFLQVNESALILKRLQLDRSGEVDLVIGLDQFLLPEAEAQMDWVPVDISSSTQWHGPVSVPEGKKFIPYDWAPLSILRNKESVSKVNDFNDLLTEPLFKNFSLQDPRTSTAGLQFLFWTVAELGEEKAMEFWRQAKGQLRMTPTWSASYGMFQKELVEFTFSYLSSVYYHWIGDSNYQIQPVNLPLAHPYQIEYAAVPATCGSCQDAKMFIRFMLLKDQQSLIARKNYMLPAIYMGPWKDSFKGLPEPSLVGEEQLASFLKNKEHYLREWEKAYL